MSLGNYAEGWELFRMTMALFVYGTLRPGFDGPMARRLRVEAEHLGTVRTAGSLVMVADYPGFVPGGAGNVIGDLFALHDPATLDWLDAYEECAAHQPPPHEYRREIVWVTGRDGPVEAWTYVYAFPADGLGLIAGGDFLACAGDGRG